MKCFLHKTSRGIQVAWHDVETARSDVAEHRRLNAYCCDA
jgi:hypothetical protein